MGLRHFPPITVDLDVGFFCMKYNIECLRFWNNTPKDEKIICFTLLLNSVLFIKYNVFVSYSYSSMSFYPNWLWHLIKKREPGTGALRRYDLISDWAIVWEPTAIIAANADSWCPAFSLRRSEPPSHACWNVEGRWGFILTWTLYFLNWVSEINVEVFSFATKFKLNLNLNFFCFMDVFCFNGGKVQTFYVTLLL